MTWILLVVILLLLCVIYGQYSVHQSRSNSLRYICRKLRSITAEDSREQLMLVTDDKLLIELLLEINRFLSLNHKTLGSYHKAEISMRKMLSNVSHDLKTPLTVVLGYIETIRLDGSLGAEEWDLLLSKAEVKAKEVLELINKFFDLAKLESGDKDIPLVKVSLNEACRKSMLSFYDILTAKGMEVDIDIPEKDIYVLGNEEALGRIMNNLLSNAIQYGSDGRTIGVTLRQDDRDAYVDVWDKGKGIDETHRNRVFERMYTLEDSRNRTYQGSGLGLTITKRLVEKQGGEIFLYSKPYEKTVFTFKLKKVRC